MLRKRKPCHSHLCEKSVKGHDSYNLFQKMVAFQFIAQCTRIKSQLEKAKSERITLYFVLVSQCISFDHHLRLNIGQLLDYVKPIRVWKQKHNSSLKMQKLVSFWIQLKTCLSNAFNDTRKKFNELSNPSFNNDTWKWSAE